MRAIFRNNNHYRHVESAALIKSTLGTSIMENIWHHRKVAETAQRACMICFKPSSSVLITPDNKDYFYICPAHLKDRNFALPTDDEAKAMEERKKKEEMDKEIASIKKEYEEKLKRKQEKKNKDKKKDDEKKDTDDKSEEQLEKEKNEKVVHHESMGDV